MSTDDTAKANQPANRTGLQFSLSLLAFFLSPGQLRPTPPSKRSSKLGKVFPWDRWGSVQCWTVQLSHPLMPAGNSAKVCRKMTLHLPGTAPATPPTDQGIWHRNITGYCIPYCVFLLGVLTSSRKSQIQVMLTHPEFSRRQCSTNMSCR